MSHTNKIHHSNNKSSVQDSDSSNSDNSNTNSNSNTNVL